VVIQCDQVKTKHMHADCSKKNRSVFCNNMQISKARSENACSQTSQRQVQDSSVILELCVCTARSQIITSAWCWIKPARLSANMHTAVGVYICSLTSRVKFFPELLVIDRKKVFRITTLNSNTRNSSHKTRFRNVSESKSSFKRFNMCSVHD
jgi:hypothetical protein